MRVRRATGKDAGSCAEIHLAARAAMAYLPQNLHTAEETRAWMRDVVFQDQTVWVAELGHQIAGYASAHDGILNNLYVLPPLHRQGIGSALVSVVKMHVPMSLRLRTFEANEGAIRFYERHGFVTLERSDGHANEENVPDRLMAWHPET
jgi:ribosomal protein S18 acetylase RimI-like enzyme